MTLSETFLEWKVSFEVINFRLSRIVVLCTFSTIDLVFHAGQHDSTSDHAAELAEARRGKRKVHEEAEGGGRSMLSQLIEAADRPCVDVGDDAQGVTFPSLPAENPVPVLDDVDDDLFTQVAEQAEVEYFKRKYGDYDDEFDSLAADLAEGEYAARKSSTSKSLLPPEEDWSSGDELLTDYVSYYSD